MQPSGKAEVAPGGSAELPVEMEFTYPTDTAAFLAFTKSSIQKLKVVGSVQTSAGTLQVRPPSLESVVYTQNRRHLPDGFFIIHEQGPALHGTSRRY